MRALKRAVSAAVFVAVAGVTLVAVANAPPDQYVVFGPGTQEIQDYYTRLKWQRILGQPDAAAAPLPYAQAVSACAARSQRLPTYRELLTLVDEDGHFEWDPSFGASTLRYIDPNAFPGTPAAAFWSMSPGRNGKLKVVDFGTGETSDESPTANLYVRCVSDVP